MTFKIYHTKQFDKEIEKFSKDFNDWLDKVEDQLVENPYVGDPIRVPWFREKKKGKVRVYYLVYEDFKTVYLVGISEKKDQQKVIDTIWIFLNLFKEEIRELNRTDE